jgi:hypothetical protein
VRSIQEAYEVRLLIHGKRNGLAREEEFFSFIFFSPSFIFLFFLHFSHKHPFFLHFTLLRHQRFSGSERQHKSPFVGAVAQRSYPPSVRKVRKREFRKREEKETESE